MPKFIVELYELHSTKWEVEAKDSAEAAAKVLAGEGEMPDDLDPEYIEIANLYNGYGDNGQPHPPGVRTIERLEEEDECNTAQ